MTTQNYDAFIAPVNIAYIGNKTQKRDTVAYTGAIWSGFGDVQVVDARAASLLLKHPTVWCKQDQLESIKEKLKAGIENEAQQQAGQQAQQEADKAEADAEKPQEDTAKIEAIKSAILALDPTNPEHYTTKGKPKIDAVNVLMPEDLTADGKEVEAIFKALGGE